MKHKKQRDSPFDQTIKTMLVKRRIALFSVVIIFGRRRYDIIKR
jgi:hypothetical protein